MDVRRFGPSFAGLTAFKDVQYACQVLAWHVSAVTRAGCSSWLHTMSPKVMLQHSSAEVHEAPDGLQNVGTAAQCSVHTFRHEGRHCLVHCQAGVGH